MIKKTEFKDPRIRTINDLITIKLKKRVTIGGSKKYMNYKGSIAKLIEQIYLNHIRRKKQLRSQGLIKSTTFFCFSKNIKHITKSGITSFIGIESSDHHRIHIDI